MVKSFPLPNEVPPVATSNQFNIPADPLAESVTVPVPQRLAGVVAMIVGVALMVATTAVRAEVHPLFAACT